MLHLPRLNQLTPAPSLDSLHAEMFLNITETNMDNYSNSTNREKADWMVSNM